MSANATDPDAIPDVDRTRWRIDPTRSSVEFHAPNFWGLGTVKGKFRALRRHPRAVPRHPRSN